MMKSFFNEEEEWTEEARQFDHEIYTALTPIIKKWTDAGFSTREMEGIILGNILATVGGIRIRNSINRRKGLK